MRAFIFVLVAVLLVGGIIGYRFLQPAPPTELEPSATPAPVAKAVPSTPPAPAVLPSPDEIAAQINHQTTAEEEAEDARADADAVLEALESIKSADPEERIAGVEQLAAFPTPEAEEQLVVTMAGDTDPEVRSAAAQSLGQFETLTDTSLTALFAALEDKSEDVQTSALDSIEGIAADLEGESERFKTIVAELKNKRSSKKVKAETRQAIKEFLEDQTP